MIYTYKNSQSKGTIELTSFHFLKNEFSSLEKGIDLFTIVFNPNSSQMITIDEQQIVLETNTVITILPQQVFSATTLETLILWRYNREFYCMFHYDAEVNCAGFLFYGAALCTISLSNEEKERFLHLHEIFIEEFSITSTAQEEMIRVLLVRLIIKLTRLAKSQYFENDDLQEDKYRLFRTYNILVEENFKNQHSVQFYAETLHKSPKTITNFFKKYQFPNPQKVIHNRIIVEAKRLMIYTEKSSKEISAELGFEEPSHFSKFFKKNVGTSPGEFKKTKREVYTVL